MRKMAGKKGRSSNRAQSALELVAAARENPYLRRLIEDRTLRRRLFGALAAARSAYGRAVNGRPPARALLEDRRLQRDLLQAVTALRDVAKGVREQPEKAAGASKLLRRSLVVAGIGSLAAVAVSKQARNKVLDLLFGKEEEFTYSPPPSGSGAQQSPTYSEER
jgi:hypothetical protein